MYESLTIRSEPNCHIHAYTRLNFRFERVANSTRMYRFPVRRAIALIEKDFPMPFVDTNDDVFLGEKSFATWHEARPL